jgi:iron transport multicopper oxidase
MLRIILPVLAACITSAAASYHNWKIGWRLLAPDGFLRPVITVNGQWPPPAIVVDLGEDVTVDIDNQLGNQSVSIHWHGMHQRNSNAMDGAAMVTQCPIPPGGVFRYEFKAEPAGTHYWRSGNKGQAQDGLRGLLIVRDKPHEQSLGIWREFMFTVSDW